MHWVAAFLLLSCGESHWAKFPAEHCPQNKCLLWLGVDRPDGWSCADLAEWERPIVEAYSKHMTGKWGGRGEDWVCSRLRPYRTFIAPTETFTLHSWLGQPKQEVSGATECYAQVMKVGNSKEHNSIFHEAGHAITECYPPADCRPGEDCAHAGWEEMGFEAAEKEARLNAD